MRRWSAQLCLRRLPPLCTAHGQGSGADHHQHTSAPAGGAAARWLRRRLRLRIQGRRMPRIATNTAVSVNHSTRLRHSSQPGPTQLPHSHPFQLTRLEPPFEHGARAVVEGKAGSIQPAPSGRQGGRELEQGRCGHRAKQIGAPTAETVHIHSHLPPHHTLHTHTAQPALGGARPPPPAPRAGAAPCPAAPPARPPRRRTGSSGSASRA